jgi:signal peptidase I
MRLRRLAIEIVQTVALTILAFYLLQTFVAQPFRVEQGSMRQTLEPGQYVLADKLTAALTGYHRGDIVIFHPPSTWPADAAGTPYIKRVIGLPGETVDITDGIVSIDGVPIDESYIYRDGGGDGAGETGHWVLGSTEILVFGDHRSNSSDSRAYGPIPISSVIGRAVLRYFPINLLTILTPPTYRQATP